MARLIYSAIMSLDGYIADADGRFRMGGAGRGGVRVRQRTERPVGTYLFGRRMYETLRSWDSVQQDRRRRLPVALDFARIWQVADKIVYSATLQAPDTARTRIERGSNRVQVRKLKKRPTVT